MGLPGLPIGLGGSLAAAAMKTVLAAIASAVQGAAADALRLTASLMSSTTSPGLLSAWFSVTYWRVAALSALLTLPFLFAAAIHALLRSDITLLGRAAFGYLPLAALGVTIAAPLATLLLTATDEMCGVVADAAGHADTTALLRAARDMAGPVIVAGSPMLAFFIGLLVVLATLGLWIELLIRAAAVDVIVLMLPLFFAAMVWPARRVWAVRASETLIALILSKFAIVAVLSLGAAAFGSPSAQVSSSLVGATLIVLAVLSPWALLRLLPLHEMAAAAAGGLSQGPRAIVHGAGGALHDGLRAASARSETGASAELGGEDDAAASVARAAGLGGSALGAVGRGASRAGASREGASQVGASRAGASPEGASRAGASQADTSQPGASQAGDPAPSGAGVFDSGTAAGLLAIERAGGRAARVAGFAGGEAGAPPSPAGAAAAGSARDPGDERPPLEGAFGPGQWDGFILGEEGDEIMQPPRFAAEEPAIGTEAPGTPNPGPPVPDPGPPVPDPVLPVPDPVLPVPDPGPAADSPREQP